MRDVIVPGYSRQTAVVADPSVENHASIRAFEKAGFTRGIVKPDDQGRLEQVMILRFERSAQPGRP